MRKLSDMFVVLEDVDSQVFSLTPERSYNVGALYDFVEATRQTIWIPLDELRSSYEMTKSDEEKGTEEFRKRAMSTDLSYPILVLHDRDGDYWIADGNHRFSKADSQGKDSIEAYVVDEDEIPPEAFDVEGEVVQHDGEASA